MQISLTQNASQKEIMVQSQQSTIRGWKEGGESSEAVIEILLVHCFVCFDLLYSTLFDSIPMYYRHLLRPNLRRIPERKKFLPSDTAHGFP